jgi:hypothetical protein
MTFKAEMARARIELEALREKMATTGPALLIINIKNDPERASAGPDEATIGGKTYLRGEDEDRGQFDARLRIAALAAGEKVIAVSLAEYQGPFLDDFRIEDPDPMKTIEIGSASQS